MFRQSAEIYDTIYGFKDYAAEAAQLAALIRATHPSANSVLDVACGTGAHAYHLATTHGFGVDGLDLDPELLKIAAGKHRSGRFFEADMSDFRLEQRYDAVICLFSSIAYLVTLERIAAALACFRRHLLTDGVVLVEPWFAPGTMADGHTVRHTGTHDGGRVERLSRTEIKGRLSRLHFDYRIDTVEGVRHAHEVHDLGLFTQQEMSNAFQQADLRAQFDAKGLIGRGLWLARAI